MAGTRRGGSGSNQRAGVKPSGPRVLAQKSESCEPVNCELKSAKCKLKTQNAVELTQESTATAKSSAAQRTGLRSDS